MDNEMMTTSAAMAARRINNSLSGKIMWLPSRNSIPSNLLEPVLENGAYNHPVVIMSNNPSPEGLVEVFLITSFGTRSIDEAFDHKWKHWLHYTPIEPAVHPEVEPLRLIEGSQRLEKQSYVNSRQAHMVQLAALRPHRGSGPGADSIIEQASLKSLKLTSHFIDLFNPRTPKRLRDYKMWEMDHKWRKGEDQAQPLPSGSVVTNPYFPAFSWLAAETPSSQATISQATSTPIYNAPTYNAPTYNAPTYNTHTYDTQAYSGYHQTVSNWRATQHQHRDISSLASWRPSTSAH
ncbi:hypothetical protein CGRA01v4_13988 [Colletotrichum graminicola]|uniref:Uncharacterized protein n=1 Tax=Colletotrichum graminicola (strain M1.001 / M2 / FGSC 10212) TaxID=645133 RepID=E3QYC8_COLGM|nr:uncharacterized protein GLRG_11057 [Colletotrichum graminicola M1.001]EFQ35866.1 hypothetical protein GLRG_11057 [Colletotrichum graminicola M1.001]WDK22698.1 hypothetical protein CGRA01v4_13988 [Colletotrichum graminicola]